MYILTFYYFILNKYLRRSSLRIHRNAAPKRLYWLHTGHANPNLGKSGCLFWKYFYVKEFDRFTDCHCLKKQNRQPFYSPLFDLWNVSCVKFRYHNNAITYCTYHFYFLHWSNFWVCKCISPVNIKRFFNFVAMHGTNWCFQ